MNDLLSDDEKAALALTATLANLFGRITGNGPTRHGDLSEVVGYIHALQHMLMAQAAARAYPADFRLLGETLDNPSSTGRPT